MLLAIVFVMVTRYSYRYRCLEFRFAILSHVSVSFRFAFLSLVRLVFSLRAPESCAEEVCVNPSVDGSCFRFAFLNHVGFAAERPDLVSAYVCANEANNAPRAWVGRLTTCWRCPRARLPCS